MFLWHKPLAGSIHGLVHARKDILEQAVGPGVLARTRQPGKAMEARAASLFPSGWFTLAENNEVPWCQGGQRAASAAIDKLIGREGAMVVQPGAGADTPDGVQTHPQHPHRWQAQGHGPALPGRGGVWRSRLPRHGGNPGRRNPGLYPRCGRWSRCPPARSRPPRGGRWPGRRPGAAPRSWRSCTG